MPASPLILQHQQMVLEAIGCPGVSWTFLEQIHSNNVVRIPTHASASQGADAMWTTDPTVALAIYAADCVPILLSSAAGDLVGAAHAGWRGTAANIASHLLTSIYTDTRIEKTSMFAAIGPAIGPCCFRIGQQTLDALRIAYPTAIDRASFKDAQDQYRVDLWALNRFDLQQAGIPAHHIETIAICTFCNPAYFSYRRDPTDPGRHAGIIAVKRPR